MYTTVNTKVGIHRGNQRVWLEGHRLLNSGIKPNQRYDVKATANSIALVLTENGEYKISSRNRNGKVLPVLDFKHASLQEKFEEAQDVTITLGSERITISKHFQLDKIARREAAFANAYRMHRLSVSSLFHGGGVLDSALHEGLQQAGAHSKIGCVVEMDSRYLESSLANNPELFDEHTTVINSDITLVDPNSMAAEHNILVAGLPCTSASRAGRSKKGTAHAESIDKSGAGALFFRTLQFLETQNPAAFILEQVTAYQSTASMEVIRAVAKSLGYELFESIESGGNFGALEDRARLVVVGISKGLAGNFSLEVLKDFYNTNATPLSAVLQNVEDDSPRWKTYSYLAEKEKRDLEKGNCFTRNLYDGSEYSTACCGRGYAKGRSTESQVKHSDGIRSRLFTPAEHAQVKSIPPKMIEGLSDTVAHEVLGQSVIYNQFKAVGALLGAHLGTLFNRLAA